MKLRERLLFIDLGGLLVSAGMLCLTCLIPTAGAELSKWWDYTRWDKRFWRSRLVDIHYHCCVDLP